MVGASRPVPYKRSSFMSSSDKGPVSGVGPGTLGSSRRGSSERVWVEEGEKEKETIKGRCYLLNVE